MERLMRIRPSILALFTRLIFLLPLFLWWPRSAVPLCTAFTQGKTLTLLYLSFFYREKSEEKSESRDNREESLITT